MLLPPLPRLFVQSAPCAPGASRPLRLGVLRQKHQVQWRLETLIWCAVPVSSSCRQALCILSCCLKTLPVPLSRCERHLAGAGKRTTPFRGSSQGDVLPLSRSGVALGSSVGNISFGVLVFLRFAEPSAVPAQPVSARCPGAPAHFMVSERRSGRTRGRGRVGSVQPVRLLQASLGAAFSAAASWAWGRWLHS